MDIGGLPSWALWTFGAAAALAVVLGLAVIALWIRLGRLEHRQTILFSGKKAEDLESVVLRQAANLETLDKEVQELFDISNQLHRLGQKSIHRVGFVRFNPFKEVGGNQSWSLALLDGRDSGFVLSGLHTRDGCRVYAKPVVQAKAHTFPLTDEEKEALRLAQEPKTLIEEKK